MKTFKQHIDELTVRGFNGELVKVPKVQFRGADGKLHKTFPGKTGGSGSGTAASSAGPGSSGDSGGGGGGSGGSGNGGA